MRLREIRQKKGLTQREVAEYIDCTPSVYSRYETGVREPSIETLIALANCLDVTIDYLVGNMPTTTRDLRGIETELLNAAKSADERACMDALRMLLAHPEQNTTHKREA